jgi:hypothetical protein
MTSKAALLRNESHLTEQAIISTVTMQKAKEEIRHIGRNLTFKARRPSNRLDVTLKRKKERCQLLPHYITWPLLIAISTACVALVTFHLWFTWHLQRKVEALQSRVETLSTLDLEELRVQLRNLYDLYDGGNTELKNSLLEQQTFAEKNQVNEFFFEKKRIS